MHLLWNSAVQLVMRWLMELSCNVTLGRKKGKSVCCSKLVYEEKLIIDFCKTFKLNEFYESYLKDHVLLVTIGLKSIYFNFKLKKKTIMYE